MRHLGVGITHQSTRVLLLIDLHEVTVVVVGTGEVIATNRIDDASKYWRNQLRPAGRWPAPI
jgi:hypothetical protein